MFLIRLIGYNKNRQMMHASTISGHLNRRHQDIDTDIRTPIFMYKEYGMASKYTLTTVQPRDNMTKLLR